uniref:BED-type domain-containing protein n=1 Tax=Lactuca sativa TaxID=4236 RepID=A0A9R1XPD3_LACSA|nr:hypothetical protein LSAT_V11C200070700 [Lactuca sativa]
MSSDEPIIDLDTDNQEPVTVEESPADKVDKEKENTPTNRKTSIVWDHFPKVKGAKKTKCKYCGTLMSSNIRNGTSALLSHLTNVCKNSPLYKKTDLKRQSTLSFKPTNKGASGSGSLATHSFNQEKCRLALAKMCIKDNRPFSVVDDEGFREFVWELNPNFKFVSRWSVARDCLSIYEEEAIKVKDMLKGQTVCLTTDTWSSVQNYNYMCLTAHWIDDDWVLQKKILNFCPIENHRGETIGSLVYEYIREWGINNVFTITVDNASSNDGAIRFLRRVLKGPIDILGCKYLHLRCCAHIINLVVQDGLEEEFDSITRILGAVTYVRSSPARYKTFKDCVARAAIECKQKPCLDVDTRWNSTYLMLETAVKYEQAFDRLYTIDSNYGAHFRSEVTDDCEGNTRKRKRKVKVIGAPSESDWETARNMIEYLKIFSDVTTKISGTKYVTSNTFFSEFVKMQATITRMCLSTDEKKKNMATSMKTKFDRYWEDIDNMNFLLHVAVVLDPRFKLRYISFCIETIYGKNSEKGKQILEKSEVDIYLADGKEKRDDNFDILGWWKANAVKFPILSKLARHLLAMPISTVASESAFSTGGRVIDKYRSSLNTKTAEALICTQDWLRSTPADLELIGTMTSKQIDELNEKLAAIEIGKLFFVIRMLSVLTSYFKYILISLNFSM